MDDNNEQDVPKAGSDEPSDDNSAHKGSSYVPSIDHDPDCDDEEPLYYEVPHNEEEPVTRRTIPAPPHRVGHHNPIVSHYCSQAHARSMRHMRTPYERSHHRRLIPLGTFGSVLSFIFN